MPSRKYEWRTSDVVAAEVIDSLIEKSGLTLREVQDATDGTLNFIRVRDIRKGLKAPVRLSEFISICQVCRVDPVTTLKTIIKRAKDRETKQLEIQQLHDESDADAMLKSFSEGDSESLRLAALHDENQQAESEGGDGR